MGVKEKIRKKIVRPDDCAIIVLPDDCAIIVRPDDCAIEDIQYHLYVIEKIRKGISRANEEGAMSQQDVEKRLSKWSTK